MPSIPETFQERLVLKNSMTVERSDKLVADLDSVLAIVNAERTDEAVNLTTLKTKLQSAVRHLEEHRAERLAETEDIPALDLRLVTYKTQDNGQRYRVELERTGYYVCAIYRDSLDLAWRIIAPDKRFQTALHTLMQRPCKTAAEAIVRVDRAL